jgi:hypothetical protein
MWSCEAQVADIDNDGDNDIAIVSWNKRQHFWLENPGYERVWAGTWKNHLVGDKLCGHDLEIADLNQDGKPDYMVRSEYWASCDQEGNQGRDIHIYRQNSPTSWTLAAVFSANKGGGGFKAGDIDDDEDIDVVSNGYWFENPGNGTISNAWSKHQFDASPQLVGKMDLADLNGDGKPELVVVPSDTKGQIHDRGPVAWYEIPGNEAQPWIKHVIESNMGDLHSLALGDIDCDGDADIFTGEMHHGNDPDELIVYHNNNKAAGWTKQVFATTGTHCAGMFDYQNDGDLDVVGCNYTSNKLEMWINGTNPSTVVKIPGWSRLTQRLRELSIGRIQGQYTIEAVTGNVPYTKPTPNLMRVLLQ